MKFIMAPVVALFMLVAGCTTTSVDQAIAKNLPTICKNATTVHLAFVVAAGVGNVSARWVKSEEVAYATVTRLCSDPNPPDTATVLVAVTTAYLEMTKALRAAEAARQVAVVKS